MKDSTRVLACVGAAAAGAMLTRIYFDTRRFVTGYYEVTTPKLSRDIRLVVLTDLHDQVYGRHNFPLIETVSELKPDLVLCVGDMTTAHGDSSRQEGEEAAALIMTLAKRFVTIAVNGNHETRLDKRRAVYGNIYDEYEAELHSAGAVVLRNERVVLPELGVAVTGLELPLTHYRHFKLLPFTKRDIEVRVGAADDKYCNILLAHHPDYFKSYAQWGADLVLSGHIHGGIIRLPFVGGLISPRVIPFPKYSGGLYRIKDSKMVLSRGLGTHTIPVRLFNPGELAVVDMKAGERNGKKWHWR